MSTSLNSDLVTKAIIKELGDHLQTNMRELKEVLLDWPDANRELKYPSLSIFTATPSSVPFIPYQLSTTDPKNNKVKTLNVVGQYEWNIQLDFWTGNKEERHVLFQSFVKAFNSQYIKGERENAGLVLALKDYHGIFATYDQTNYSFDDSEAGSQRREWRVQVNILAETKQVLEREQFAIINTEIVGDLNASIEADISTTVVIPD